jgi:lipopolysaccharide export system protein LptC
VSSQSTLPAVTPAKDNNLGVGGLRLWWLRTRKLADQLTAYVPLALMAVLAGMTFWLLRLTPVPDEVHTAPVAPKVPDNYLVNFVARSFDASGELSSQVAGDAAQHLPATGELRIQVARMIAWGDNSTTTDSTAKNAVVNQAQTQFELTGDVVVNRRAPNAPHVQIVGQQLFIDTELDRMRTDLPVVVRRDADEIKAQRMVVDNASGITQFDEQVRAVLQPKL